jgi:hypothetical protein
MSTLMLRLPSPGFSPDLRTGDAGIDRFLEALDGALVGSAGIRRATVLETRDTLLEVRDRARAAGEDEAAAVSEAIAAFGTPAQIGDEQRRGCASRFRKLALAMGLLFAALMLVIGLVAGPWPGAHPWGLAVMFVLQALLFGLPMGFLFAYVIPAPLPTARDAGDGSGFDVHYPPLSMAMARVALISSGGMEVAQALGLAGLTPLAQFRWQLLAVLLVINAKNVLAALDGVCFRAQVVDDILHLRTALGGAVQVPRARIVSIVRRGPLFQLLWPTYGRIHRLAWRDDDGRVRHRLLSLNRELVHGDRLLAWCEQAARAQPGPAGDAMRGTADGTH